MVKITNLILPTGHLDKHVATQRQQNGSASNLALPHQRQQAPDKSSKRYRQDELALDFWVLHLVDDSVERILNGTRLLHHNLSC